MKPFLWACFLGMMGFAALVLASCTTTTTTVEPTVTTHYVGVSEPVMDPEFVDYGLNNWYAGAPDYYNTLMTVED